LQVPIEKTFCSLLEATLISCPKLAGRSVEVFNFGVSGFGTAQELLVLHNRVWQYNPDIVILAFCTGNDIMDNSRALGLDPLKPYFVQNHGKLLLDNSFRSLQTFRRRRSAFVRFYYWTIDHSYLMQLVQETRRRLTIQPPPSTGDEFPDGGFGHANVLIYRAATDPTWREAWNITEDLILATSDEVKSHGAKFLLMTLSNAIQVHPDRALRRHFENRMGIEDLFYPEQRISSFCQQKGIAVLQLARSFQDYADQFHVFLHGFGNTLGNGHWNEEGHRLASQKIAERLCADF